MATQEKLRSGGWKRKLINLITNKNEKIIFNIINDVVLNDG